MASHFVADLHLRGPDDRNTARLHHYLSGAARRADALYVLGDLFDVWVGDDGSVPIHRSILDAFAELVNSGVPVYFMRGNRDFAVGDAFVYASRMTMLDDPTVVDIQGTATLLSHGDLLCSDDHVHQAFRARYTNPHWRARMLKIPLWLRRLLAQRARRKSAAGKTRKAAHIMDVNADTVRAVMHDYGVTRLIHGHTHRPAKHAVDLARDPTAASGQRIVLADWRCDQAEVLIAGGHGFTRQSLLDTSPPGSAMPKPRDL